MAQAVGTAGADWRAADGPEPPADPLVAGEPESVGPVAPVELSAMLSGVMTIEAAYRMTRESPS